MNKTNKKSKETERKVSNFFFFFKVKRLRPGLLEAKERYVMKNKAIISMKDRQRDRQETESGGGGSQCSMRTRLHL